MDVNQTKFHLLYGPDDWGACYVNGQTVPLSELWDTHADPPLEWDAQARTLRLARTLSLFRRAKRTPPLDIAQRRGADRDRYGNWYWIDDAEQGIQFLSAGERHAVSYWQIDDLSQRCEPANAGTFEPKNTPTHQVSLLRGLTVTHRHYLVVGDVEAHGIHIFDLHGGGAPLFLGWPDSVTFAPWDMAATGDGGLAILDKDNLRYWVLDADFRLMAAPSEVQEALFQPKAPAAPPNTVAAPSQPLGYALSAGAVAAPTSPISIEPGPDGTVLLLDTHPDRAFSIVYVYQGETQVAAYSLEDAVTVMDPDRGEGVATQYSLAAHDFVHLSGFLGETGLGNCEDASAWPSVLYLAERDGNQVMAFVIDNDQETLVDQQEFLPLRQWQAKALVRSGNAVYFDFADRWVSLQPLVECHYVGRGVLTTPTEFDSSLIGSPFDSGEPGCVWHRLLLDAQIPPGTSITARARAADDPRLLPQTGWIPQPVPYLRSDGAELPYYNPWTNDGNSGDDRTGTWELLFQGIKGRYAQLELTLQGTGRSTPAIRALRAWYPRFSYLDHYLPAIYREEPVGASFMERWLANAEGFLTALEGKIEHAAALFDPRTTTAEALDWLGCWMGVVLDPLWDERKRRFFIRHADRFYRQRGTVAGVVIAVRLYLDSEVDERLFEPACWAAGRVRLVERFRTRDTGGLVYGDPTGGTESGLRPVTLQDVRDNAHRFVVLVPHDLNEEEQSMVERIVELEKPVQSAFELKQYWALFRVGEVRLGIDTQLGQSSRFVPVDLGSTYLADGYLAPAYPFDVADRLVVARDRLGDLPAL